MGQVLIYDPPRALGHRCDDRPPAGFASNGIGLADAIVAATVQQEGADLQTLNVRHYPMLTGLKPAYSKRDGTATE